MDFSNGIAIDNIIMANIGTTKNGGFIYYSNISSN
jgi:hypothetical protein